MSPRSRRSRGWCAAALAVISATVFAACGGSGDDGDKGAPRSSTTRAAAEPVTSTSRRPVDPPVPAVRAAPVGSTYENPGRVVSRDGGVSVALPNGTSMWMFGDTGVFERVEGGDWVSTEFIDGSTAMLAKTTKGVAPIGIELPTGVPERFLPVPDDVYLPDGSGQQCNADTAAFAARWPLGAALFDPDHVVVTYSIVCVTRPDGIATSHAEGWGYALYNWKTRQFDHGPDDVFAPSTAGTLYPGSGVFVSPLVARGKITLFSSDCSKMEVVRCGQGAVWSTTMPATVAALSDPASYKITPAATTAGRWEPLSVSVGRYREGLRLVEMTTIVGDYRIFTASRPGGPWKPAVAGTLPGCPTVTGFCLALEGHPELSTATQTFVSYKDADLGPGGHIVISSLP